MKKKLVITLVIVGAFYGMLYFWNQEEKEIKKHPTIHAAAAKPDDYLMEAKDFEIKNRHDKSATSIEQAIQAIWKLEKDVDDESFERLEKTVAKLEAVHRRILRDSIPSSELLRSFEYALGNLAYAELEVAEKYSESHQLDKVRSALIYAQLHIKNALIFHQSNSAEDSTELIAEVQLLNELDSLLKQDDVNYSEYSAKLDVLIQEVDQLLGRLEEN